MHSTCRSLRAARQARREFLDRLEPLRSDLYVYCRRLTGNAFDAEDLVQESLARAFTQAAQAHSPIANPRAWLFRVATNAYVDNYRRQAPVLVDALEQVAPATADPVEVRDAWAELVTLLPPQERAALALKDLFGFTLAEVACASPPRTARSGRSGGTTSRRTSSLRRQPRWGSRWNSMATTTEVGYRR